MTRKLNKAEIENEYELNTGRVIVETFKNLDYEAIPAVLVQLHCPFAWGKNAKDSVCNAIVLEEVAKMFYLTKTINPKAKRVEQDLLDKHYFRKHGKNAYYGQK